jgi:hypothetical protein
LPFTLVILGIVLLIAAVRGTQDQLFTLVKNDFTGPKNFIYWSVAILFIGALGYIPKLKPLSVTFMVLIVIVLVLARGNPSAPGGGFFQQFTTALNSTQTAQSTTAPPAQGTGFTPLPDLSNLLALPLTF